MAAAEQIVVTLVHGGLDVAFALADFDEVGQHVQREIGDAELVIPHNWC